MSMRGRYIRCNITYDIATYSGTEDLANYQSWYSTHPTYSGITFDRWMKWRSIYGTTTYGNLPQHKKYQHVGYCWAPCPYSTQSSDARTENMTGNYLDPARLPNEETGLWTISGTITFSGTGKVDHGIYYMKNKYRGFECTFDGCPYYLYHGKRYFYI